LNKPRTEDIKIVYLSKRKASNFHSIMGRTGPSGIPGGVKSFKPRQRAGADRDRGSPEPRSSSDRRSQERRVPVDFRDFPSSTHNHSPPRPHRRLRLPEKSKSDLKTAMTKEEQEFKNNMDIPVEAESQDDISYVHPKKPKMERDIKPEFYSDIKIKIEPIEEFNRGMGIITNMNVPASFEIKNENIDVPKIEMEFQPKIETDFQAKSEPIDDINMNIIPNKAEIQNENYKCSVCELVEFTGKHLLIQHMAMNHRNELRQKQQCSKCFELFDKMGVFEKIDHFVIEHADQNKKNKNESHEDIISTCRICKKKFSEKSLGYQLCFTCHTTRMASIDKYQKSKK